MSIVATTAAQQELSINAASYSNGIIDLANDDDEEEEKREHSSLSRSPQALNINLKSGTSPSQTQKAMSNDDETIERKSSNTDSTKTTISSVSKSTYRTRDSSHRRSISKTRSSKKNMSSNAGHATRPLKNRSRSRTPRSKSRSRSSKARMRSRSRSRSNKKSRSRSKQRHRSRTRSRSLSRHLLPHHRYNGGSSRRMSRTPPPFSRQSNYYSSHGYRGNQRPYSSSHNHNGHSRHFNGPYRSPDSFYDRFNAPQNNVLAVFGLDKRANEQDLFDVYRKYGCKECKIIMDKHTGNPKGYGFVYFTRVEDASKARQKTDGLLLLSKNIRVDFSIGERDFAPHLPTTTLTTQQLLEQQQNHHNSSSLHAEYYNSINYHRDRTDRIDRDYIRKERSVSRGRPTHIESSSLSSSFHRNQRDHSPLREREREREREYRDLNHREQRYDRITTPRSPRSPRSYHESMLAPSSLSKSKHHANFCNDPSHHHHEPSHNHDLEKIKLIVNYAENGTVKTRTTRLIEDDTSYIRRDDKFEPRKIGSSTIRTPPRVAASPSPSPPPISYHHLHGQHRSQQAYKHENNNQREIYHREAYAKRSRTRSRSRSPHKNLKNCYGNYPIWG